MTPINELIEYAKNELIPSGDIQNPKSKEILDCLKTLEHFEKIQPDEINTCRESIAKSQENFKFVEPKMFLRPGLGLYVPNKIIKRNISSIMWEINNDENLKLGVPKLEAYTDSHLNSYTCYVVPYESSKGNGEFYIHANEFMSMSNEYIDARKTCGVYFYDYSIDDSDIKQKIVDHVDLDMADILKKIKEYQTEVKKKEQQFYEQEEEEYNR